MKTIVIIVIAVVCSVVATLGILIGYGEYQIAIYQDEYQNQVKNFKTNLVPLKETLEDDLFRCGYQPVDYIDDCEFQANLKFQDKVISLHEQHPLVLPGDYELPEPKKTSSSPYDDIESYWAMRNFIVRQQNP